jgi:hypothetical protein
MLERFEVSLKEPVRRFLSSSTAGKCDFAGAYLSIQNPPAVGEVVSRHLLPQIPTLFAVIPVTKEYVPH